MQVFGIDFTSAPAKAKPITCAQAQLRGGTLTVHRLEQWEDFDEFEALLAASHSAICGIDFPFGQPRRLIEALEWPPHWQDYVGMVAHQSKATFVAALEAYSREQPSGEKHHFRATDRAAQACSPMMIYGVPVAKMFYEGATRLAASPISVLPCRPTDTPQVAAEVYPGQIARQVLGRQPYKNDTAATRTQRTAHRRHLLNACQRGSITKLRVRLAAPLATQIVDDAKGDGLDAVLAALQIASAYRTHGAGLGIPSAADPNEGWIVDTPSPNQGSLDREP